MQHLFTKITVIAIITMLVTIPVVKMSHLATGILSISGNEATCSVIIQTEKNTDEVEVTVELFEGSGCIKRWSDLNSHGTFSFSDTVAVIKGKTYVLKTTAKINGKSISIADVKKRAD